MNKQVNSNEQLPWQVGVLAKWAIVGMNHYYVNGQRFLFVAMVYGDTCIKEEGPDDQYLWHRLHNSARGYGND